MNILDLQTIINIKTEFLDDDKSRTQFTVNYINFDSNGVGSEQSAIFSLTPKAQEEILEGIIALKKHLSHKTF